jgi:hypothetical protein
VGEITHHGPEHSDSERCKLGEPCFGDAAWRGGPVHYNVDARVEAVVEALRNKLGDDPAVDAAEQLLLDLRGAVRAIRSIAVDAEVSENGSDCLTGPRGESGDIEQASIFDVTR